MYTLFVPCVEDAKGRLLAVVGPKGDWKQAMQFLERFHKERLLSCRAVPQPADHPGLVW